MEMRTSIHAEEEIRLVIDQMAEYLIKDYPLIFGDYAAIDTGDGLTEYVTDYGKV
jgi:hypothetical protein